MTITAIRTVESTHTELGVGQRTHNTDIRVETISREELDARLEKTYGRNAGIAKTIVDLVPGHAPTPIIYGHELNHGVGSWFVFDRQPGEPWHLHCGPYATREEAEGWIMGIREA